MKLTTALLLIVLVACPGHAHADGCGPADRKAVFDAVAEWGKSNSTAVASTIRDDTASEYCKARSDFARTFPGDLKREGDAIAAPVVREYLDQGKDFSLGHRQDVDDVTAILGHQLGHGDGALTRPYFPQWGVIEIEYKNDVDEIEVGTETFGRVKSVMAPAGSTAFAGKKSKKPVCKYQIDVRVAPPSTKVTC